MFFCVYSFDSVFKRVYEKKQIRNPVKVERHCLVSSTFISALKALNSIHMPTEFSLQLRLLIMAGLAGKNGRWFMTSRCLIYIGNHTT